MVVRRSDRAAACRSLVRRGSQTGRAASSPAHCPGCGATEPPVVRHPRRVVLSRGGPRYIVAGTFLVAAISATGPSWLSSSVWIIVGAAAVPSCAAWTWLEPRVSRPPSLPERCCCKRSGSRCPPSPLRSRPHWPPRSCSGPPSSGSPRCHWPPAGTCASPEPSPSSPPATRSARSWARWSSSPPCTAATARPCWSVPAWSWPPRWPPPCFASGPLDDGAGHRPHP